MAMTDDNGQLECKRTGRIYPTSNVTFIFTSNLGRDELFHIWKEEKEGKKDKVEGAKAKVRSALKSLKSLWSGIENEDVDSPLQPIDRLRERVAQVEEGILSQPEVVLNGKRRANFLSDSALRSRISVAVPFLPASDEEVAMAITIQAAKTASHWNKKEKISLYWDISALEYYIDLYGRHPEQGYRPILKRFDSDFGSILSSFSHDLKGRRFIFYLDEHQKIAAFELTPKFLETKPSTSSSPSLSCQHLSSERFQLPLPATCDSSPSPDSDDLSIFSFISFFSSPSSPAAPSPVFPSISRESPPILSNSMPSPQPRSTEPMPYLDTWPRLISLLKEKASKILPALESSLALQTIGLHDLDKWSHVDALLLFALSLIPLYFLSTFSLPFYLAVSLLVFAFLLKEYFPLVYAVLSNIISFIVVFFFEHPFIFLFIFNLIVFRGQIMRLINSIIGR
jgi:hypothetical protein